MWALLGNIVVQGGIQHALWPWEGDAFWEKLCDSAQDLTKLLPISGPIWNYFYPLISKEMGQPPTWTDAHKGLHVMFPSYPQKLLVCRVFPWGLTFKSASFMLLSNVKFV